MDVIEIRELDGPNVFALAPMIKIELATSRPQDDRAVTTRLRRSFNLQAHHDEEVTDDIPDSIVAVREAVLAAHRIAETPEPAPTSRCVALETPGHFAVVYGWTHRRFARFVAERVARVVQGEVLNPLAFREEWIHARGDRPGPEDAPALLTDSERSVFTITVTGTNGKTTTTRLLAHIFRQVGKSVGWCSSSGVYINGTQVMEGDYSGPSGARRVLTDPTVEVGIVEAARGGILLRGLAYQSNDISVFTNISADHLDLHGVRSVEGLAQAKSVVCKVTKPDGCAVVNADDPLVMNATEQIAARRLLFSRGPAWNRVDEHRQRGGSAVVVDEGTVRIFDGDRETVVARLVDIPLTFGGRAGFMTENVLAATGAAHAAGLTSDQIRAGLCSFQSDPDHNPGRLNLFQFDQVTVVIDYAHNEAGLTALIDFARSLLSPTGRLITVIGTAGDRKDESIIALGRIAAERSDHVIAKGTQRYLRGRAFDDLLRLYTTGIESFGETPYETSESELTGLQRAVELAGPGDVIAIMAQEDPQPLFDHLRQNGGRERPTLNGTTSA